MGQILDIDDGGDTPLPSIYEIETLLDVAMHDPNNGRAAAAFAAIQSLHVQADRYERDLVRSLRWDAKGKPIPGRTWVTSRNCWTLASAVARLHINGGGGSRLQIVGSRDVVGHQLL